MSRYARKMAEKIAREVMNANARSAGSTIPAIEISEKLVHEIIADCRLSITSALEEAWPEIAEIEVAE